MAEIEKRNNGTVLKAVLVLLGLIAGLMTYLWYDRGNEIDKITKEKEALDKQLKEVYNLMPEDQRSGLADNLLADFKAMRDNYDMLKEKGRPEDQAALDEQKSKINGLIDEIKTAKRKGQVSGALIAKLQKENETLRQIMIGYVKQIDELNTKNYQLTTDLDKTTSELTDTKTELTQTKTENEDNKSQLGKAKKLVVSTISSTGLRMKLNDMPEATTKARNCVQAKADFTIGENAVANAGAKVVYMQITDPDGKPLQGRTGGSASTDAGNIVYSAKREINYANKAIDVSIFYDFNGEEPVKGNYKVRIYCDGTLIGSDSFSLK